MRAGHKTVQVFSLILLLPVDMMDSNIWKPELIEHLIMLWEEHPVLYASSTTDENCKRQQLEALNGISLEMSLVDEDITMDIIKMKLNFLRSQFFKEFKRLKDYRKRGVKAVPKLEWYDQLLFLQHNVEEKLAISTPKPSTTEREFIAPTAKKRKTAVVDTDDGDFLADSDGTEHEEKKCSDIHDWLENKIDDLKSKLEKLREERAVAKMRSKIKKEIVVDVEDLPQKPRSFKSIEEQVVCDLNQLHSQRLQGDAAWAIQKILHESLVKNRNLMQSTLDDDESHVLLNSIKDEVHDEDSHKSIEQLFLEHFD